MKQEAKAIRELYRIIRPGGHSLLALASYYRAEYIIQHIRRRLTREREKHLHPSMSSSSLYDHVRLFAPLDIRKKMAEAGFIIERFECFGGRLFGKYFPVRIYIPKLIYIGDHCLLVLKKPIGAAHF